MKKNQNRKTPKTSRNHNPKDLAVRLEALEDALECGLMHVASEIEDSAQQVENLERTLERTNRLLATVLSWSNNPRLPAAQKE